LIYQIKQGNIMQTMTRQEELQSIYWDMYKDAHGIRPRHVDTTHWTEADFNAEFEMLQQVIIEEDQLRKAYEARAVVAFEERVLNLMHPSTNRERVIAWLMDAEGANGDFEYFAYTQGLPYGYFRKTA
jgi:hypothetical protein